VNTGRTIMTILDMMQRFTITITPKLGLVLFMTER
jgi:hypothetical protein